MSMPGQPPSLEEVVTAKIKRRVLPLLMAGWLIAYIDRFNVGFAALQMNKALGLSATALGFAAGLFFVGYALFEVPSNLCLARFGARRWLARIMVTWGIVTIAMAWAQGPNSFSALRFVLGVAEAGCFPGMALYLSKWFLPRQRAGVLALLGSMAMLSGVVGGPVAAVLLSLDGVAGLAGWQWLFVIEGVPAITVGLLIWRFLPEAPHEARWLTSEERDWLARNVTQPESERQPALKSLRTVLHDARYWGWGLAFLCTTAAGSASTLFRPILMRQMAGLSDGMAATLNAVPAAVGVLAMLYIGRHATATDERRWHSASPAILSGIGLFLGGVIYGLPGVLALASVAALGGAFQPPLMAMVSSASKGTVNAVGIAFVNSVAAAGGFAGPYLLGFVVDSTGGFAAAYAIAGMLMVFGAATVLLTKERRQPAIHAQPVAVA
jgi:ACS family tartrate transporter-like MFS transporter